MKEYSITPHVALTIFISLPLLFILIAVIWQRRWWKLKRPTRDEAGVLVGGIGIGLMIAWLLEALYGQAGHHILLGLSGLAGCAAVIIERHFLRHPDK